MGFCLWGLAVCFFAVVVFFWFCVCLVVWGFFLGCFFGVLFVCFCLLFPLANLDEQTESGT